MRLMEKYDLTIDEVDALTGPLIGRAKSATFRTADISGLDVLAHVTAGLSAATGEDFALPAWVQKLVRQGRLGEKTGCRLLSKDNKDILTLDWKTGEYEPQPSPICASSRIWRRNRSPSACAGATRGREVRRVPAHAACRDEPLHHEQDARDRARHRVRRPRDGVGLRRGSWAHSARWTR